MADKLPFIDYGGILEEIHPGDKIPIANLATGTPDGTKFIRDDGTLATPPGGGGSSFALTQVEVDLGSVPRTSGSFSITSVGLTASKAVSIQQAVGPYTGKGTLADETEMDMLIVTGVTTSTTNINCYWNSPTFVKGNFKFNYIIST